MSSLLRLPTLDRPYLGLTKRFSLLSTNTASSTHDEFTSSTVSLTTLPSLERLESDDFLNMFDDATIEVNRLQELSSNPSLQEPPSTPTTTRFPELHGTPVQRFELAPTSTSPRVLRRKNMNIAVLSEQDQVGYRSSVSSSIPSTKLSNASSRMSRRSSKSSQTEDLSSSDYSAKESDKENALHERLKRRSRGKSVSFGNTAGLKARSETSLPVVYRDEPCRNRQGQRPSSRGERLGRAMADSTSPPQTPKSSTTINIRQERHISNTSAPRRSSSSSPRTVRPSKSAVPSVVDNIDYVRMSIMSHLEHINDLQACAQVSWDFYMTFQKYETMLVDSVLYRQSPAAWELRYSVRHLEKPSPFRLRSVLRDYATVQALEDFIVWRCQFILRPQSLAALLGDEPKRKAELEDAVWLIWCFCNAFGKTSASDATLSKQAQWLNGGVTQYGRSSTRSDYFRPACTMKQLEDMSELWRCLENLLSGFRGREDEARQAGIFDNAKEAKVSDSVLLSAWIHDILSLGPKAVLTLSSCDFEQAKVLGITRWSPPTKGRSRATFLKAAVEDVYRERLMKQARQKAQDYRKSVQHSHKRSSSDPAHAVINGPSHSMQAHRQSLRVDTRQTNRQSMSLQGFPSINERIDIRPDCDPLSPVNSTPIPSANSNPMLFSPLSLTKNVSARLGPTLFPMQNRDQSQRYSVSAVRTSSDSGGEQATDVIDPTDKAMALLVQDMGFPELEAKRALAMSDTGSGISVERAIELLAAGVQRPLVFREPAVCELPAAVGNARLTRKSSKREVCEGHCKPLLLVESRRDRVSGLGMVKRGLSYRMSFRKSNRLSMIPDDEETPPNSPARSIASSNYTTRNRDSALSQLASSTVSVLTAPLFKEDSSSATQKSNIVLTPVADQAPVSPIVPAAPYWLRTDTNSAVNAHAHLEGSVPYSEIPPKPRITLQRVGTGVRKSGWGLPGRRKAQNTPLEIIGYAY